MSNKYQEPVYQYRVMRQMDSREYNPNGDWTLVYSSRSYEDAQEVLIEQVKRFAKLGDVFKIKDAGPEVKFMTRSMF